MYKNGLEIRVTKNNIRGIINGVSTTGLKDIYSMMFFYEDGKPYFRADVHEETITDNLKFGAWEICEDENK